MALTQKCLLILVFYYLWLSVSFHRDPMLVSPFVHGSGLGNFLQEELLGTAFLLGQVGMVFIRQLYYIVDNFKMPHRNWINYPFTTYTIQEKLLESPQVIILVILLVKGWETWFSYLGSIKKNLLYDWRLRYPGKALHAADLLGAQGFS